MSIEVDEYYAIRGVAYGGAWTDPSLAEPLFSKTSGFAIGNGFEVTTSFAFKISILFDEGSTDTFGYYVVMYAGSNAKVNFVFRARNNSGTLQMRIDRYYYDTGGTIRVNDTGAWTDLTFNEWYYAECKYYKSGSSPYYKSNVGIWSSPDKILSIYSDTELTSTYTTSVITGCDFVPRYYGSMTEGYAYRTAVSLLYYYLTSGQISINAAGNLTRDGSVWKYALPVTEDFSTLDSILISSGNRWYEIQRPDFPSDAFTTHIPLSKAWAFEQRFDGVDLPNIDYMDAQYADTNDIIGDNKTVLDDIWSGLFASQPASPIMDNFIVPSLNDALDYLAETSLKVAYMHGTALPENTNLAESTWGVVSTTMIPDIVTAIIDNIASILGSAISAVNSVIDVQATWDVSSFINDLLDALLNNDLTIQLANTKAVFTLEGLKLAFGDHFNPPKQVFITLFGVTTEWWFLPYIPIPIPGFVHNWVIPGSDEWDYGASGRTESNVLDVLFDLSTLLFVPILIILVAYYAPSMLPVIFNIAVSLFSSFNMTKKWNNLNDILEAIMLELGVDVDDPDELLDDKVNTVLTSLITLNSSINSILGKLKFI